MQMIWNPNTKKPVLVERSEYLELKADGWLTKQPDFELTKENENESETRNYTEAKRNSQPDEENSENSFSQGEHGNEDELRDKRQVPNDRKRKAK